MKKQISKGELIKMSDENPSFYEKLPDHVKKFIKNKSFSNDMEISGWDILTEEEMENKIVDDLNKWGENIKNYPQ